MSELAKAQATTEDKRELAFYLGIAAFQLGIHLENNPFNVISSFPHWFQWRAGWRHARDQKL